MPSLRKISQKNELDEFFRNFPNFTLIKFDKTSHQNLENLRKQLKTMGAKMKVIKNTIFEKALISAAASNKSVKNLKEKIFPLKHNTAILGFDKNWSQGLSSFYKFTEKEKTLAFKGGILDNTVYLSSDLEKIAKLPSREVLLGKVIGSMKSPVNHTVYAMKYGLIKFVYVLKAKGGETNG